MSTADWLGVATPAEPGDTSGTERWLGGGPAPGELPKLAEPEQGAIGHAVGVAGEALARGLARVPGIPGDLERIGRWVEGFAPAGSASTEDLKRPPALPSSNELAAKVPGGYQPRNLGERYVANALEGGPSGVTTGLLTGMGPAGAVLSTLGSSAAEQTAKELLPEQEWAAPMASVAGGAKFGLGIASAKEAGVRALGSEAEEAASGTGAIVQGHMRRWLQSDTEEGRNAFRASGRSAVTLPEKETEAWDRVSSALSSVGGPSAMVVPRNYEAALNEALRGKGELSGGLAEDTSPFLGKLEARLDALNRRAANLGIIGSTDWNDAKDLRSQIGDALNDPKVVNSLGQKKVRMVYGALTEDMRDTAQAHGVLPEFEEANAASVAKNNFKEQTIDPYISGVKRNPGQEPTPEEVSNSMVRDLKKGATGFQALHAELPEASLTIRQQMVHDSLLKPKLWQGLPEDSKQLVIPSEENRAIMDRIAGQANGGNRQTNMLAGILASEVGSAAGVLVPKVFGEHLGGVASEALGRAAGALTPLGLRKVGQVARTPEMWQGAGVGAMTSPENPLYGPMPGSTP